MESSLKKSQYYMNVKGDFWGAGTSWKIEGNGRWMWLKCIICIHINNLKNCKTQGVAEMRKRNRVGDCVQCTLYAWMEIYYNQTHIQVIFANKKDWSHGGGRGRVPFCTCWVWSASRMMCGNGDSEGVLVTFISTILQNILNKVTSKILFK
jgi:hypothetical protein